MSVQTSLIPEPPGSVTVKDRSEDEGCLVTLGESALFLARNPEQTCTPTWSKSRMAQEHRSMTQAQTSSTGGMARSQVRFAPTCPCCDEPFSPQRSASSQPISGNGALGRAGQRQDLRDVLLLSGLVLVVVPVVSTTLLTGLAPWLSTIS